MTGPDELREEAEKARCMDYPQLAVMLEAVDEQCLDLIKRLEAAEARIDDAVNKLDDMAVAYPHAQWNIPVFLHDVAAALAGKE